MVVQSQDLPNNPELLRLLQAIATVSASHPDVLNAYLDGMLVWREAQLTAAGRLEVVSHAVPHAVEVLFGLTALRVLLVPGCGDALVDNTRDQLEEIASSHLLGAEARTTAASGVGEQGMHVALVTQMRFAQRDVCDPTTIATSINQHRLYELNLPDTSIWFDSMVTSEVSARIIGVLSRSRLYSVTARFLPKLEMAVRPTVTKDKALLQTHEGMTAVRALRYVWLGAQQIDYSVDFLSKVANLIEQQRLTIELKHELCALLAVCLERFGTSHSMRQTSNKDGEASRHSQLSSADIRAWDTVVARIYLKISEWAAKPKHLAPTCRALAALLVSFSAESDCVQEHSQALVQLLVKYCSDKTLRGAMLASLRTIVKVRLSSPVRGFINLGLVETVERVLESLIADIFRRPDSKSKTKSKEKEDSHTLTVAHLELLVEAVVFFGSRERGQASHIDDSALKFVIEQLVVPSLGRFHDSGYRTDEMQLQFGIRTFNGICREYEALLANQGSSEVTAFNPKGLLEPRLQRYARKIGPHVATLLIYYTDMVVERGYSRSEEPPVQMTITLVGCIPRAIPLMPYDKLQERLITLALGNLKDVREAALACFIRFVHLWPPLRTNIMHAFCEAITQHKDSNATRDNDRILRAARGLKVVVDEWASLGNFTRRAVYDDGSVGTFHGIREDWAGSAGVKDSFVGSTKIEVVIESTALYLLCSTHPEIRSYGFEILQSSHGFEERFLGSGNAHTRRLSTLQILENAAPAIIERASAGVGLQYGHETSQSITLSQLVAIASSSQQTNDRDQVWWCRCLAEVCTFVTALRVDVASSFCQLALHAAKASGPSAKVTDIRKWRNYTVAALCAVNRKGSDETWQENAYCAPSQEGLIMNLIEMAKTCLYSPYDTHRSASVLVLGLVSHPAVYDVYSNDLTLLDAVSMNSVAMTKDKEPKDEESDLLEKQLRVDLMNIHKIIAERLQLSALGNNNKVTHLLSFIELTVRYSKLTYDANESSSLYELEKTLRADFCCVVRHVAEAAYDEGGTTEFTRDVRTRTFKLLSEWCPYGMAHGIGLERRRKVDVEHARSLEQVDDLNERRERSKNYHRLWSKLENAAYHTICYLFWGPVMEEVDPELIFKWGEHLFKPEMPDPAMWHPMLNALEKHLISSPFLLPKYIDHCYDSRHVLAQKSTSLLYFNAITAACSRRDYSEESDLAGLWVLALYHSTSTSEAHRKAAALLLQTLITQIKSANHLQHSSASATIFAVMVTSTVSDTFESQANLLSSHLSSAFPEYGRSFLLEVFRRMIQPTLNSDGCNRMITILTPWMRNFVLGDYHKASSPSFSIGSSHSDAAIGSPGSPGSDVSDLLSTDSKDLDSSQILSCIFSLTLSFGVEHSQGIQMLWRSIVANRARNTVHIVSYCIDKVVDTYENDPEGVFVLAAQKILLYMARCDTGLTVRTLMDRVSMLPESPSSRISYSNVATILLIEIIHESSAVHLSDHTPLLLHIAILGIDHKDKHYAKFSVRLLINLLQTMVLKALANEDQARKYDSTYTTAKLTIQFLESRGAQDMWHNIEAIATPGAAQTPPAELQWAIEGIVDSMVYSVPDLRLRWSNLALQYTLMDRREDVVARSHQIFRFLRHEVQLQHAKQILFSSHAYCIAGHVGTAFLSETAATIECVMKRSDQLERVCMLFPHFFWFASALCQSDTHVLYNSGLRLLRIMLPIYAANHVARRSLHIGLAAAKLWSRPFRGTQELMMRGLSTAQTEEDSISTLRLLLSVSLTNTTDGVVIGGSFSNSLAVQLLGALLPWLCHNLDEACASARSLHPDASNTARDFAALCAQRGLQMLASSFLNYAEHADSVVTSGLDTSAFLETLSEPLRDAIDGVGIAGNMYGLWLAHLGPVPAGLHPRRYARQVLQVLQVMLRDPTHLLAAQTISAEEEVASSDLDQTGDLLTADTILPLLIKRVSEFAAVRDLSQIAVQVLSAAAIAQERLAQDISRRRPGEAAMGTIHALDKLVVGKIDSFDEESTELKGTVVQAWTADDKLDTTRSYLSLQLGDEVMLAQSQYESHPVGNFRKGFIFKRRTASGLLVPLGNIVEGLFPTACVRFEQSEGTNDTHNPVQQQTRVRDDNGDTAQALFAICRTLPGCNHPVEIAGTVLAGGTATCDEHACWLETPIVIPSDRARGLLLKPRVISVAASQGSGDATQVPRSEEGRIPLSEVFYQSPADEEAAILAELAELERIKTPPAGVPAGASPADEEAAILAELAELERIKTPPAGVPAGASPAKMNGTASFTASLTQQGGEKVQEALVAEEVAILTELANIDKKQTPPAGVLAGASPAKMNDTALRTQQAEEKAQEALVTEEAAILTELAKIDKKQTPPAGVLAGASPAKMNDTALLTQKGLEEAWVAE